jgi:DNA-binding transcriptional ArsR family regulator
MTDETPGHAIPIAPDDAFSAVSNGRRRRVLLALDETNESLTASALAVEIAAIENGITPSQVTGKQRSRVYVSLIQSHLGILDDLGVAAYDGQSKCIASTDATEPIAEHIRRLETACFDPEGTEDTEDDDDPE